LFEGGVEVCFGFDESGRQLKQMFLEVLTWKDRLGIYHAVLRSYRLIVRIYQSAGEGLVMSWPQPEY